MLATVGLVVPEFVRVPGAQFSFEAIPNVLGAHDALLDSSMKQILLWVSLAEVCTLGAISNMNEFDRPAGDYSFDPLKLYPKDPVKQKEMKLKELKNGRLVRNTTLSFSYKLYTFLLYIHLHFVPHDYFFSLATLSNFYHVIMI